MASASDPALAAAFTAVLRRQELIALAHRTVGALTASAYIQANS